MNNLTQNETEAKQAYLNRQIDKTVALYENADRNERNAIIKHIDLFLSTESKASKAFWLKIRSRLKRSNE